MDTPSSNAPCTKAILASPIITNGFELTHRRKSILDLPVDIELAGDVTITVLSELVEIDKELKLSKSIVYRIIRNGELEVVNFAETNTNIAQKGH